MNGGSRGWEGEKRRVGVDRGSGSSQFLFFGGMRLSGPTKADALFHFLMGGKSVRSSFRRRR